MTERLPRERCIGCRRKLTQVGGQRIVFAVEVEISLIDRPTPSVKVRGLWNCLAGNLCPWVVSGRAKRIVQSGRRPWACQRCTGTGLCFRCGTPYKLAPGADILSDDGKVLHVPLVAGMGRRCERCEGKASRQPPRSA
jgi:hypothetical protein